MTIFSSNLEILNRHFLYLIRQGEQLNTMLHSLQCCRYMYTSKPMKRYIWHLVQSIEILTTALYI